MGTHKIIKIRPNLKPIIDDLEIATEGLFDLLQVEGKDASGK